MTSWNGNTYAYEPAGMTKRVVASGVEYDHIYTADDERLWTFQPGSPSRFTVRDLDGSVLREFKLNGATWTVEKDYVYRDGVVLSAVQSTGEVFHLHPDHLGSPRLITRNGGAYVAYHVYHPYGAEATAFNQDTERLKFTAHERDLGLTSSASDDLDYMHNRYFIPTLGRFQAADRLWSWEYSDPQTWNRYAYARSNPLRYVDLDGQKERSGLDAGRIKNESNQAIWIAGDVEGIEDPVVIPLDPGESSLFFMEDADAVIISTGQSISGQTGGAFKVGPTSVSVSGNSQTSLRLSGSLAYHGLRLLGAAGHSDPPADKKWVIPPSEKAARKLKSELRKTGPLQKALKPDFDKDRIKLPPGRLLRLLQRAQKNSDPFHGTGFCSADNVCH